MTAKDHPPCSGAASAYTVTAGRDSCGWVVRVEGLLGAPLYRARDLSDVEPRALKLIGGYTGLRAEEIDLDVEVQLPETIEMRLDLIASLAGDIDCELEAAVAEMLDYGLTVTDIGRVVRGRYRPVRALTVRNAEIAEHGLDRHPEAVALRWDDHGCFVTLTCRACVEAQRHEYRLQPPDEENGLLYEGRGMFCDLCEQPVGTKSSMG